MERDANNTRQEVLLAAAVMAALKQRETGPSPKIEDISSLLYKLKNAGVDLGDIALRRVPGGFYSEDIENLIGHYLAAGYATQESPVELTEKGKRALSEIIETERRDNPGAMRQIESALLT